MHAAAIKQLIVLIEAAVLNDKRDFKFAARQAQRAFFFVLHHDQPGETAIDLRRRRFMRMRMVEIHAGAIAHLEFIDIAGARRDGGGRMAVSRHRHMQTMPMRNRVFRQIVFQPDADFLAFHKAQGRAEIGA